MSNSEKFDPISDVLNLLVHILVEKQLKIAVKI